MTFEEGNNSQFQTHKKCATISLFMIADIAICH